MNESILLEKRKNRLIARILSFKEKEIDPHIDSELSEDFREFILDEINGYYSIVYDVVENNINQEFLDMFAMVSDLHQNMSSTEAV